MSLDRKLWLALSLILLVTLPMAAANTCKIPRIVVLRFDGGFSDQLDAYNDVLKPLNLTGVFSIPTGLVPKAGLDTFPSRVHWEDIWYLNQTGNDVISLGRTHPASLGNLSMDALWNETAGSLDDFHWQGLHPKGFAYPHSTGAANETVLQYLQDAGYLWATTGGGRTWDAALGNEWNITSFSIDDTDGNTTDTYFQNTANLASGNTVVVFLFNHIGNFTDYNISLDSFTRKIDWLKANNFDVMPLSQVVFRCFYSPPGCQTSSASTTVSPTTTIAVTVTKTCNQTSTTRTASSETVTCSE